MNKDERKPALTDEGREQERLRLEEEKVLIKKAMQSTGCEPPTPSPLLRESLDRLDAMARGRASTDGHRLPEPDRVAIRHVMNELELRMGQEKPERAAVAVMARDLTLLHYALDAEWVKPHEGDDWDGWECRGCGARVASMNGRERMVHKDGCALRTEQPNIEAQIDADIAAGCNCGTAESVGGGEDCPVHDAPRTSDAPLGVAGDILETLIARGFVDRHLEDGARAVLERYLRPAKEMPERPRVLVYSSGDCHIGLDYGDFYRAIGPAREELDDARRDYDRLKQHMAEGMCTPESDWGCEARRKLGIARGALSAIAVDPPVTLAELTETVEDVRRALEESGMPNLCEQPPNHDRDSSRAHDSEREPAALRTPNRPPTFDGKVFAALSLKVALDDEDSAKVGALVEEVGRLRDRAAERYELGWNNGVDACGGELRKMHSEEAKRLLDRIRGLYRTPNATTDREFSLHLIASNKRTDPVYAASPDADGRP